MSDKGMYVDPQQLARIQATFRAIPIHMRKSLRSKWGKEGTKITKHVRITSLSGPTGTRSISMGGFDKVTPGGRKRIWADIHRTVKVAGKRAKSMGGFLRVGFSGRKPHSSQYIAFFHEFGTRFMPARTPIESAWEKYPQGRIISSTDDAIDEAIRKAEKA